jgi:hypothetical protein
MRKAILGVFLVAIFASIASALPWMVTATSTNVKGWTISVPLAASYTVSNLAIYGDSGSGFYIQVVTAPTYPPAGYYYCKADSTGKASKYTNWWYYDSQVGDTQLGATTFNLTRPPAYQE